MYSYRLIWFYRGLEQAANKIRLFLDRLTVGLRQRKEKSSKIKGISHYYYIEPT